MRGRTFFPNNSSARIIPSTSPMPGSCRDRSTTPAPISSRQRACALQAARTSAPSAGPFHRRSRAPARREVPPRPGSSSTRLGRFGGAKDRGFADAPLEGAGFEPSVPRRMERTSGAKSDLQEEKRRRRLIRRNKAAARWARQAPDQPSRKLPPPPSLFEDRPARWGAWQGADELR